VLCPEIPMVEADTLIEYQPLRIGNRQALLPNIAELTVRHRHSRNLQRNRISESMTSFLAPQALPPVTANHAVDEAVEALQLRAGLRLPVRLETALDSTQTGVGTPVIALVDDDVIEGWRILIPKGARLPGRVRSLAPLGRPARAFEIGLEFSKAEWPHGRAHFTVALEDVEAASGARLTLPAFVAGNVEPAAIGLFYIKGAEFKLETGLKMLWRTLP
jgi:hypothetical protein